ncbi:MAG TPA: metallopeptidase TldD-related protein, partial [Chroococcales cyanobacterium]
MKALFGLFVATATATAATTTVIGSQDDVMFKAMTSELERSIKRLRINGHEAPYYLSYTVHDTNSVRLAAAFGAVTENTTTKHRDLNVDLRIGDYKLDSSSTLASNQSPFGRLSRMFGHSGSLPYDDDYDSLRHKLWLATDASYKQAVESLESNKRYLKDNNVEERPDAMSREQPVVLIKPAAHLELDNKKWAESLRKLSGMFRDYPKILRSHTSFAAQADTRWFINNEGFTNRIGETCFLFTASGAAQAADGMVVSDNELIPAWKEIDLPNQAGLESLTKRLAERLIDLTNAPALADDYRGPVLFEGQASAEFFDQVLATKLCANRQNPMQQMLGGGDLSERIGQRILPSFMNVIDDPTAKEYKGAKLFGTCEVDDDGVRSQKITLVEKGLLKTLAMSRTPTKELKQSNGHSRYGSAALTNLFITTDAPVPFSGMKEKLIQLGKEDGLKYVYIVRKITDSPLEMDISSMQSLLKSIMRGGSGVFVLPPVLVYQVSTADGKEQLVRGAQFVNLTMRSLRDIEAAGDDARAYPIVSGQDVLSAVAPSVLVKEIEL